MIAEALARPVGFVLGGGGSLGASQVGMLQALAEQRVTPNLVVGSSVGSLNGAIVALDPVGAANRLSHAWARLTRNMVFPGGLLAQARTLQRTRTNLFPSSGLAAVITSFLGTATSFAELALPFGAVTTDVATAQPYMISSGPLLPALLASAAIPALYPPVDHDGRRSTTAASWPTCQCGKRSRSVPAHSSFSIAPSPAICLPSRKPPQTPFSTPCS